MIKTHEKYITVVDSDNDSEGNANDYGNDNEDDCTIGTEVASSSQSASIATSVACNSAVENTSESTADNSDEPKNSFQYIPILDVIKRMIELRDVWQSIQRQLEKETHKNEDLCHHLLMVIFEKHMMPFFGNKCAICIYVYVDEFKVCNSIGAHRTTHKLIAFFYFIGNLEDKYHSQLKYVHLCLLVKEKLIKKHENLVQVLQPLIDNLNKLHHDGISVNVEGTAMRLFGGLVNISADNLSVHAVACFRRVFNSGRICRQCMVLCNEKEQLLREADTTIRTESMR